MTQAVVIRGRYTKQGFIPEEPMPTVEGRAELIVFPMTPAPATLVSIFDLFGKAPRLRTAEDIEAQIQEEREAWGDR